MWIGDDSTKCPQVLAIDEMHIMLSSAQLPLVNKIFAQACLAIHQLEVADQPL
jgi:hypothetical protein